MVTDFVTRLMRPKYLLKKSDRYMYVYIYVCVCVCKCMCICMCVYMYYITIGIIYFFPHPFFVCIYRFSTRCILTTTTTLYFPLLEYYFHIIEYKK